MGFLSGVLDAVKDDDAVKTYDKDDDNNINTVIKKLQSQIGSGRAGLAVSVDAVKGWLEGYGKSVKNLTGNIIQKFSELDVNTIRNKISDIKKDRSLRLQLEAWTSTLDSLGLEVENINKNVDKLDSALKNKLKHETHVVKNAVEVLKNSAESSELVKQVRKVDETLVEQQRNIQQTFFTQTKHIYDEIYRLMRYKGDQFKVLKKRLMNAQALLGRFDGEYDVLMSSYFDEIKQSVRDVHRNIEANKMVLDSLIKHAWTEFRELKLKSLINGGDENNSVEQNWNCVKKEVTKLVKKISNVTVRDPGAVQNIIKGVTTYAWKFNKTAFADKVKEWIKHIFQSHAVVQHWIGEYVGYIKKNFPSYSLDSKWEGIKQRFNDEITKGIADAIADAISGHIRDAFNGYDEVVNDGIEKIEQVTKACEHLAAKLNSKIKEAEVDGSLTLLADIATAVETEVLQIKDSDDGNYFLQYAVKTVLYALYGMTQQFAAELRCFLATSSIKANLESAISSAASIDQEFKNGGRNSHGEKIDDALLTVNEKVKKLGAVLDEATGSLMHEVKNIQSGVLTKLHDLQKDDNDEQDGTINKKRKAALNQMDQLKKEIDSKLNDILESINDADRYLDIHIEDAENSVQSAERNVNEAVTSAFEKVEQSVRSLFAQQHKADLEALHKCVETQLQAVKEIIDVDSRSGIKCLLKVMNNKSTLESWRESLPQPAPTGEAHRNKLANTAEKFKQYVDNIQVNVQYQLVCPGKPIDEMSKLSDIEKAFDKLLDYLTDDETTKHARKYLYDNEFTSLLTTLTSSLTSLSPSHFANPRHPELLDAVKKGLQGFVGELERVYVNGYDGHKESINFDELVIDGSNNDKKLTDDGRNLSKVFLTISEILVSDFEKLRTACNNNQNAQINLDQGNRLGSLFYTRGYGVATGKSKQDGELQNKSVMNGKKIKEFCENTIHVRGGGEYNPATGKVEPIKGGITTLDRFFGYLYDVLTKYRTVCHIKHIGRPRTPTTINQMLHWVNGLPYTTVYNELTIQGFGELFEKPEEEESVGGEIVLKTEDDDKLLAYPEDITAEKMRDTLTDVCRFTDRVLVCILGHGHAEGRYACDFSTNPDGLLYPSNASACLDMLVDILKRLYEQFYFLFIQCSREKDNVSWRDCWYGRHVGGSDWRCNEKQCINQMVNQSADQKANQSCGQTCDRHPSCGLKSPLQSFLEDGLPGFLPHSIKKPGCKLDCTVSNHRGLPCKTPMGFGDISLTASRASRGERMMKLLDMFCGQQTSPLTKLCGYFNCLLQMPPQTLGDMFAFYYNFIVGWGKSGQDHRSYAFEGAVNKAIFGQQYGELNVKSIITDDHSYNGATGDLMCLVSCKNASSSHTCGRYLQPISFTTWATFSEKHADKYLSWIVYLTETFYNLLEQLYKECCEKCGKQGTKCYDKSCRNGCPVKASREIKDVSKKQNDVTHTNDCASIAQCPFTRPTLCRYGFVLKSLTNLRGATDSSTKRTCGDFCSTMKKVLNNVEADAAPLAKLIYVTIPKFLFEIRKPFMLLTLALWLLSLLYLTHIMVIRLDLLHIKSHLHSPSSHRIAAQSLLAAGRVNKLGRVFYLQP
ncbi:hypothetical protein, conserved [Babesia bigemina]|uniref:C3H1-type domain-containing protein n=1 Tax=Babesia bigemina TaxID=5866 RepID=A0A061BIQ5_BABBI|nr:hypothetical protein, conserved [Babesia bigemina]CDR71392.1 hypothetical protein, conserved [Babesia bigemina]|eukprot:XP_012770342.1 hypothetical protein, conserved [Babesia bigemina]